MKASISRRKRTSDTAHPEQVLNSRKASAWGTKLLILIAAVFGSCLLAEVGLRLFSSDVAALDERGLMYRYEPTLGWFPRENSHYTFSASRTVTVTHNSRGFREAEPVASAKPAVVFLGDSLVWGFDVEASERFTDVLQARHPEFAVHNLGVSGYGTDQEFLLLQRNFAEYRPRVVFLVICGDNDNEDNAWNCRGGYYKPHFKLEGGGLKLYGVPVPKSEKTFATAHRSLWRSHVIRLGVRAYYRVVSPAPMRNSDPPTGVLLLELRKFVTTRGATFAVGLQHTNRELETFLKKFEIPYVELETTNPAQCYPGFGHHWTPAGHQYVADQIDKYLKVTFK